MSQAVIITGVETAELLGQIDLSESQPSLQSSNAPVGCKRCSNTRAQTHRVSA